MDFASIFSGNPITVPATSTFIAFSVALRTVKEGLNKSPSRANCGKPGSNIKSCVVRIDVLPVPKYFSPPVAMAIILNLVRESFKGTCTSACPEAFNFTLPFQRRSVSNNSLLESFPPPPPGGNAFKP